MENKLTIKESYNLILSNVHSRYTKLIEEGYIIKIKDEIEQYKNKYNDYSEEEKRSIREKLVKEVKEDSIYELPLYYLNDDNKDLSMKDKYNLYMMESSYKSSLNEKYYENTYLMKDEMSFYLIKIHSEDSLNDELHKTTKEDELELFYDYEKIELEKNEFDKLFLEYIENVADKYFLNYGLQYRRDHEDVVITKGLEKDLEKSILTYIYEKQKNMLRQFNKEKYPKYNETRFKLEFVNGNIVLDKSYVDIELFNSLKLVLQTFINNNLSKVSFDKIKEDILLAKKDFNKFLINNKNDVSNIVIKLLENSSDFIDKSSTKKSPLEDQKIKELSSKNDIDKSKLEFEEYIENIDSYINPNDNWNILKGFAYENIMNYVEYYKNIGKESLKFPDNISKVINDKIYSIDFKNKEILWSFVNEEQDIKYHEEQKEIFNEKKVALMTNNPQINKEELRKELSPILSRKVEPEQLLTEVKYDSTKYLNSKYFVLNNILIQNVDLFVHYLEKEKNNFSLNKDILLLDSEMNSYKNKDNIAILSSLMNKYNIDDNQKTLDLLNLISKLNLKQEDSATIKNILEYIDDSNKETYKKVLEDYYEVMQKKMYDSLIKSTASISNDDLFKNEYFLNKLFYIMETELTYRNSLKNNNSLDEKDEHFIVDKVTLDESNFSLENTNIKLDNLDSFFNTIDNEIALDIVETDDLLKDLKLDFELE